MTEEERAAQVAAAEAAALAAKEVVAKREEKLLTQDEVNAIVQGKVNKLKEKYTDYEDLKKQVSEFDKVQKEKADSELSELQLAQKDLEEKNGSLTALQEQLEKLRKDSETKAIRSAFTETARKANIEYVEDAFALADLSSVTIEGEEVKGIEDIIANLVERKPFLLAVKKQQQNIGGRSNGQTDPQAQRSFDELLKAAADKAKKTGRLEDKLAYVNLKSERK